MLGLFEGPAEIACAAVIVTSAATGRFRGWRPGVIELGVIVWVLVGVVGTVAADGPISSEDKYRPLLALGLIAGARGVAGADAKTLTRMAWAFCVGMVVNGAFGYLQYAFGALPLEDLLGANPSVAQRTIPDHEDRFAASGLFFNRLKLAHVGIIALGVMAFSALRPGRDRRVRALAAVGGLVLTGAILLTWARAALPAALAAGAIVFLVSGGWSRGRLLRVGGALATVALVGGVLGAVTDVGQERFSVLSRDIAVRLNLFEGGLSMFADHPWFGVGHGAYRLFSPEYVEKGWGPHFIDGHSIIVHTLAETGIIGFLGFASALGAGLWALFTQARDAAAQDDVPATVTQVALYSALTFTLLGLAHFVLHHATVALIFWVALGVGAARRGEARRR